MFFNVFIVMIRRPLRTTRTDTLLPDTPRVRADLFGPTLRDEGYHFERRLLPLALSATVVPSIGAIFQDDVKRLLAYSSIGQIGYMALGVASIGRAHV